MYQRGLFTVEAGRVKPSHPQQPDVTRSICGCMFTIVWSSMIIDHVAEISNNDPPPNNRGDMFNYHVESIIQRNFIRRYTGGIHNFTKNIHGHRLQSRWEKALAKFTNRKYKDVTSNATVSRTCSSRGRGRHSLLRAGMSSRSSDHLRSASLAAGRSSGSVSVIHRMSGSKKSTLENVCKNHQYHRNQ